MPESTSVPTRNSAVVRTTAASTVVVLRLAEAATLASAALVRSVIGQTRSVSRPAAAPLAEAAPAVPSEVVEPLEAAAEVATVTDEDAPADEHDVEGSEGSADSDAPPVPLWDQLSLARIRGRLPHLSLEELRSLREYEDAHAGRPQILLLLENRIRRVEEAASAQRVADDQTQDPSE